VSLAHVKLDFIEPLAIISLMRPEKRNAINLDMLADLVKVCDLLEARDDIRAVILTGEGHVFSSGGDIKAWAAMLPSDFGTHWVKRGHHVFARLAGLKMPLIAAINGHAIGGGLELAGVADIRVAGKSCRFGLPEPSLGMVPGWSGTQRLAQRFGVQIVRRMVLGGEIFNADEAKTLGLIDKIVDDKDVLNAACDYGRNIAARSPVATQISKLMLSIAEGEDRGEGVEMLSSMLVANSRDLAAGVQAFKEKRTPIFEGKW